MDQGTKDRPYREIGQRLTILREMLKLRPKDVAKLLQISGSRWGNWENGTARISLDSAIKLAEEARVTLDYIYLGEFRSIAHDTYATLRKNQLKLMENAVESQQPPANVQKRTTTRSA